MLIGHQNNWQKLKFIKENQKVYPGYIFYGIDGIGKKQMALLWAKLFFCQKPVNSNPCNVCAECLKIEHGNHPDLILIKPDGQSHKVDEIRRHSSQLQFAPVSDNKRFLILDQAHLLTLNAANSLLKSLEEVKEHTHFIFITHKLFGILPTIRSRCQSLFFHPLTFAQATKVLKNQPEKIKEVAPEFLKKLLVVFENSPGLCLSFLENQEDVEAYQELISDFAKKPYFWSRQSWVSRHVNQVDIHLLLEMLRYHAYRGLRAHPNHEWHWLHQLDAIDQSKTRLAANANKTLVLENLLINLDANLLNQ